VVVEEGLKPGEVVISDGTMKVRDGVAVNAKLENTGTEVGK